MKKTMLIAALALGVTAAIASVVTPAQTQLVIPPKILSGSDFGFRVDRNDSGKAVGMLMVRIDGQWVEATFASGIHQLVK